MQFEKLPLQRGGAKLSGRRPVALLAGLQRGLVLAGKGLNAFSVLFFKTLKNFPIIQ
jgi:hypothetical protein